MAVQLDPSDPLARRFIEHAEKRAVTEAQGREHFGYVEYDRRLYCAHLEANHTIRVYAHADVETDWWGNRTTHLISQSISIRNVEGPVKYFIILQ